MAQRSRRVPQGAGVSDEQFPELSTRDFLRIIGLGAHWAHAVPTDGNVCLSAVDDTDDAHAYMSPNAARALATQLLKAARWAEGDRT